MSTSRIEVQLTPPPPHFDDEATIATARQVVPIKGSRTTEGRRKVLALLPLLIASTLCGALGAIAVNYFERAEDTAASVTQQQPVPDVSTQAKTEPAPVPTAPELSAQNPETQASVQLEDTTVEPADESTKSDAPKTAKREDEEKREDPERKPPAPVKPAQDAAKLVRKRRVQPEDSEIPVRRNRRSAASRIEDLFTGPNP